MIVVRSKKIKLINTLVPNFSQGAPFLLIRSSGISASKTLILRKNLHAKGAHFRMMKNSLIKRLIENASLPQEFLQSCSGALGFITGGDTLEIAKVVSDYARDYKGIEFVSGFFESKFLDQKNVENLSKLPSLAILRGQLLGTLKASASKYVRLLSERSNQLAIS
jgi:ribosomal protein L10